jgi:GNAT superfamily N-acetyltransferase
MSTNYHTKSLDAYTQIIVDVLLTRLRNEGGYACLDRFTRSEFRREGITAADLKRAINAASERDLITLHVRADEVPVITLVKKEGVV